jgi:hypothetical protein
VAGGGAVAIVSILFIYMGAPHGETLEANFCFGLVCKVVMEVQRSFILFIYVVHHVCKKVEVLLSFLILSIFFMNSLFPFPFILFFVLLLFLLLCEMEKQGSCMLNINRLTCFCI